MQKQNSLAPLIQGVDEAKHQITNNGMTSERLMAHVKYNNALRISLHE